MVKLIQCHYHWTNHVYENSNRLLATASKSFFARRSLHGLNDNGKDGPHMINHTATAIAHEAESIMPTDYIAGVAVIIPAEVLQ